MRFTSLADLISIFTIVWFFLGNVWVYSGMQCKTTSPYIWWPSLAVLIIAYLRIAEILLMILAVVFFLPGERNLRFWTLLALRD